MKILVYGAGVIGSVYAAFLREGGHEVTVLARGRRLEQIREHGIRLEAAPSGRRVETKVEVVEELDAARELDLVLVALPAHQLEAVLPGLASGTREVPVVFVGNHVGEPRALTAALGADRVLMGFPDFGGFFVDDRIRFATRTGSDHALGLTLGELDGRTSERVARIAEAFAKAGIVVEVESRIEAWLTGHVALVLPILFGLARHANDTDALALDGATLGEMARAIREGLAVVRALGHRVTPLQLRLILWLPARVTAAVLGKMVSSEFAKVAFAGHAGAATSEFEQLWADFHALAERSRIALPSLEAMHESVGG